MSDYFDNLIARSVGRAQVVQPRPVSLFEPLRPIGLPNSMIAADQFAIDREVDQSVPSFSVEPLRYEAAPSTPDAGFLESPSSDRRESQSIKPSQRHNSVIDLGASQSSSLLIPRNPATPAPESLSKSAEQPEQHSPSDSQTVETHSTVIERVPLRAVLRAATLINRQSNSAQDATPIVPAQAASESAAPQIESIAQESPHSLLVAPSITPKPVSRQQREDRLTGSANPILIEADAQVVQAPAIKITIGRVDVRAVMPERPAPRPAPERRSPALSLEEYLKQRSGGKP